MAIFITVRWHRIWTYRWTGIFIWLAIISHPTSIHICSHITNSTVGIMAYDWIWCMAGYWARYIQRLAIISHPATSRPTHVTYLTIFITLRWHGVVTNRWTGIVIWLAEISHPTSIHIRSHIANMTICITLRRHRRIAGYWTRNICRLTKVSNPASIHISSQITGMTVFITL